MQGYAAAWCSATRELRVCYPNLLPGDYTFQVRAIDRDLNYSETAQVLDEVGEMSLETQDKILRLLAERTFERIGGNQILTAQTRMVAATDIVNTVRGLKEQAPERELVPLLELERRHIIEVLNATNGRIKGPKGAAAMLGVSPSTLYSKMRKLDIKRS